MDLQNIFILPEAYQIEWYMFALAGFASFIIGIAKGGIKGIGVIIVTIMALVFGSKPSTGIVLPLLIVGDVLAVWYYKKHVKWKLLIKLLPWIFLGVIAGAIFGKDLDEHAFKKWLGGIIFFSALLMLYYEKKKDQSVPTQWWFAGIMGLGAGFTTMIGNMAGAFSNLFFLAMRLKKNEFIGTAAWLFFIVNLFKLPFHVFAWKTIDRHSLHLDLLLLPFLFLGFWAGINIVKKINDKAFRTFILVVTFLGALLILIK